MKLVVLVAVLGVSVPLVAAGQTRARPRRGDRRRRRRPRRRRTGSAEAYAQFLLGAPLRGRRGRDGGDRRLQARDGARSDAADDSGASSPGCICRQNASAGGAGRGRTGAQDRAGQPRGATACSARIYAALGARARRTRARGRGRRSSDEHRQGDRPLRDGARDAVAEADPTSMSARRSPPLRRSGRVRQGDSAAHRSRQPGSPAGRTARCCWWRRTPAPAAAATRSPGSRSGAADNPRLLLDARRLLRARAALGRRRRRLRAGAAARRRAARHPRDALRVDADEHRRPRRTSAKARDVAARGDRHPRHRRARALLCSRRRSAGSAIPAAAEATARKADRAEQQEPARLLRAGRGARGAAPVPGGRRRARAGRRRSSAARPTARSTLGMLLPHLGFAYQETRSVRQGDRRRSRTRASSSPNDPAIAGYLIEAQHRREEVHAPPPTSRKRRCAQHPDDLRLTRLEVAGAAPQRQGRSGRRAAGGRRSSTTRTIPIAYVALAQAYSDAESRRAGGEGAAGRAGQVPDRRRHHLRARRRARQAEEVRRSPRRRSARC